MKDWNVSQKSVVELLSWYAAHKRELPWRADRDPYHVWVSEIMLQQTRVEAVKAYYLRFMQALPDVEALACADEELLLKLWEGLGYYNRVRNMQKAAKQIVAEYGGQFPQTEDGLRALCGIGPYTAAAIASICFSQPTPAVDGNVLRVMSRLCANDSDIALPKTKEAVYHALAAVDAKEYASEFTQAWMELGATVCLPNGEPLCDICPLREACLAHREHCETDYPQKSRKALRRMEQMTVYILKCGDRYAIRKRAATGLLASLWEFPHIDEKLSVSQALERAEDWSVSALQLCKTSEKKHIFTHKEWEMFGVYLECANMPKNFIWAKKEELEKQYALPTAFRQFLADN